MDGKQIAMHLVHQNTGGCCKAFNFSVYFLDQKSEEESEQIVGGKEGYPVIFQFKNFHPIFFQLAPKNPTEDCFTSASV